MPKRLPFPTRPDFDDAQTMLFTKFDHWKYEQEIRIWAALNEKDDGLFYSPFGEKLELKKVIAGARCSLSLLEINQALGSLAEQVTVIKGRAGFTKFEIVKDKRGFNK